MREGFVRVRGYRTWYRVAGDLDGAAGPPLLALHGGPGVPHDYLEPLEALAAAGRPVVLYDQLGCGHSDVPDDATLRHVALYLEELAALRDALGLGRVHLFGHSWGGMLALEYLLTRPAGVASVTLAGAIATNRTRDADRARVYAALPPALAETLRAHEAAGTTADPAYRAAQRAFQRLHACRVEPLPDGLRRALARRNPRLGGLIWESGAVRDVVGFKRWSIEDHLGEIAVPALVTAGRHDGIAPGQDERLHAGLPDCERVVFADSAHYPHLEEPARYLAVRATSSRVERHTAG